MMNARIAAAVAWRCVLRWLLAGALLSMALAAPARSGTPLSLHDAQPRVEAWPALGVVSDPAHALSLADVQARDPQPPGPVTGTLGLRRDTVWLHLPLHVDAASDGRWVLDIGYAVLNEVDVYLVVDGREAARWAQGNLRPRELRPLASRGFAVPLDLAPGTKAELWIRVRTGGAMILPITLSKPAHFHAAALDEQMLQGLLTGLGLFLILTSLAQWASLREGMYWKYALLTSGSLMFSVAQFGLGGQYLWGDSRWLEFHVPGLAALLAATGTFLFVDEVLAGDQPPGRFRRTMQAGAAALLLVAAAFALDAIDVHVVSWVVGTLGLAPAVMGLPGAVARVRRGDPVGGYFLVAWLGYFVSTFVMVSVIKGRLPADWWTLHAFQFGATLDMLLFMRVMSLRLVSMHAEARRATHERETLRSQAHSDPLTGLLNRRGLAAQLDQRLAAAAPDRLLALFVLDLDGFKAVNDRLGHEAGDALLVAVAGRLRERLREHDLMARLGGDEFVVVADGLRNAEQAESVAGHLLHALDAPFDVQGQACAIGLTAGYVLAPLDGRDARELLKAADAAMYAGKQAGKQRVLRALPA